MMNPYGLYNRFLTQAGMSDQLADILIQAAALVGQAPGCRVYLVNKDSKLADCIWVTEIWDSAEQHRASLNTPGVKELIGQALPLLAGRPEQTVLEVLGGKAG